MKSLYLFLLLGLLSGCAANKNILDVNQELESCLNNEDLVQLNKLVDAMDKHITRVARFSSFLDYTHQYYTEAPNLKDFTKEEVELGIYFNESKFKERFFDFSYWQRKKKVSYDDYLANPDGTAIKTVVSFDKPFLKCLDGLTNDNPFIASYLAMDMTGTSPKDFARFIYENRNATGFNQDLAKKIVALECYLLIVEVLPKLKSVTEELDCP